MKSLVVAQQKGGVGKTSIIVHLAFDFFERGLRVGVIDLDTQGNASYTLENYASKHNACELFKKHGAVPMQKTFSGLPPHEPLLSVITSDAALADNERELTLDDAQQIFIENVQSLAPYFDVLLIDTAPALGTNLAVALLTADFVVSPIELEVYSMQGVALMENTIDNVKTVNSKLKYLGLLLSKVDSRNPRHVLHKAELEQLYPEWVIPTSIGLRSSIADALASQIPVWKIRKTTARRAAKEIRAMAEHIFEKMELA